MLRPRFEAVSLRFGCHEGQWELHDQERPVVIAGPNGSGKSTLVSGLVRTLFGFDRRRTQDGAEMEARQPWRREGMRGRVVVRRNGDRYEIHRNFTTNRVRVYEPEEGVEHFLGDGNPAARNQEARHYRQILTDLLGLREMDAYRQTLLIRQGDLPETALGDHLLQIAAGGHARVEAARWQIAQAHRAVTRRPLHTAAAAAINPRELEKLEEEIAGVQSRLSQARTAGERRTPLTLGRDHAGQRLATLDREIDLLENALTALAHTDATELKARRLRQQVGQLDQAAGALLETNAELEGALAARRDALSGGAYPDDFAERLARAEVRWHDLEELQRLPAPRLGAAALAIVVAAVALFFLDYPFWAAVAAAAGGVCAAGWGALWLWGRRRRSAAQRDVTQLLHGVPDGAALGPGTRHRALARFRAQQRARARVDGAREEVAEALRDARTALAETDRRPNKARGASRASPDSTGMRTAGSASLGSPSAGAGGEGSRRRRRLLDRVVAAAEDARERLAMARVELDRIGELSLALPDDVPPTEDAVSAALRERRAERARAQESLQDVSQELLERGTPSESVEALESMLESLESRREALARKAEVLESAHALILDAYDEFRDRDQDRLAERVAEHVKRLGAGRLEGIRVEGSLDEAMVRTRGRLVPMATPPLSFGEFHALQLAVRLGAADFLGGIGIAPPLIIDEPFAHLDAERAATVWDLLVQVAAGRQVVITTQDVRLLEDLGVRPDIQMGP